MDRELRQETAGVNFAEYQVPGQEGAALHVSTWVPEAPRAAMQISHGMAEHARRYADFARYLAAAGIAVYASDHAGHGKSASPDKYGYFYAKDGWKRVVDDLHSVRGSIEAQHPGLPVFLFGHSMGSMLARSYMSRYAKGLAGVILCGTSGPNPLLPLGKLLAGLELRRLSTYKPSQLLNRMAFGANNKPFEPSRTPFDWLSRDKAQVDAYIADPACGFAFTATGYSDLFAGLTEIQAKDWAGHVPCDLRVLVISGECDPVGGRKAASWLLARLNEADVRLVECKVYPEARHEILNEINREEVYADVLAWVERVLAA